MACASQAFWSTSRRKEDGLFQGRVERESKKETFLHMWVKTKAHQSPQPSLLPLLLKIPEVNSSNKTPSIPRKWLQSISSVTQPHAFVQKLTRPSWGPHYVPHLGLKLIGPPWGPHCVPVHCCSSHLLPFGLHCHALEFSKCSMPLNLSTIVKGLLLCTITRQLLPNVTKGFCCLFCRRKFHYKHTRVRASSWWRFKQIPLYSARLTCCAWGSTTAPSTFSPSNYAWMWTWLSLESHWCSRGHGRETWPALNSSWYLPIPQQRYCSESY